MVSFPPINRAPPSPAVIPASLGGSISNIAGQAQRWYVGDGAITATLRVLTTTRGIFASAAVGQLVWVQGAGAAGAILVAHIASIQSADQVTLDTAAGTTVTAAAIVVGTDATAAVAAAGAGVGQGGAIYFPPGVYMLQGGTIGTDGRRWIMEAGAQIILSGQLQIAAHDVALTGELYYADRDSSLNPTVPVASLSNFLWAGATPSAPSAMILANPDSFGTRMFNFAMEKVGVGALGVPDLDCLWLATKNTGLTNAQTGHSHPTLRKVSLWGYNSVGLMVGNFVQWLDADALNLLGDDSGNAVGMSVLYQACNQTHIRHASVEGNGTGLHIGGTYVATGFFVNGESSFDANTHNIQIDAGTNIEITDNYFEATNDCFILGAAAPTQSLIKCNIERNYITAWTNVDYVPFEGYGGIDGLTIRDNAIWFNSGGAATKYAYVDNASTGVKLNSLWQGNRLNQLGGIVATLLPRSAVGPFYYTDDEGVIAVTPAAASLVIGGTAGFAPLDVQATSGGESAAFSGSALFRLGAGLILRDPTGNAHNAYLQSQINGKSILGVNIVPGGGGQEVMQGVPPAAPTDADIAASAIVWYLDEVDNTLKARTRYSDGLTLKSIATPIPLS